MTRRKIYFFDKKQNKLYATPEFNGDKEEFIKFRKTEDRCDKNFDEILKEFEGANSLEKFEKASNKAQSYYHSFLGDEILPIQEKEEIELNDEIYMINEEGKTYLYNPSELNRKYFIDVANKGKFVHHNLTMKCEKYFSKVLECEMYTLDIESIPGIITKKSYRLGTIENEEIDPDFDNEFNKEIKEYIEKIEIIKKEQDIVPLKLGLIRSPNSNYLIAFKSEKENKYVLDCTGDVFGLIKLDPLSLEPMYNLNIPIEINGEVINPIFDNWLDNSVYKLNEIDVAALEMASLLCDYMAIQEGILDTGSNNKNLNEIYEDIYNENNINKYFFDRYKDDEYIEELKERYYKFLGITNNQNEENEEKEL